MLRVLNRTFRPTLSTQMRLMSGAYEGHGKATIDVLNENKEILCVDSYGSHGFRLNDDTFVCGPIALFPRSVLQWRVKDINDITPDSLTLFTIMEPRLDVLVVGYGANMQNANVGQLFQHFRKLNIGLEFLPTMHACTTFNLLNSENRAVAAALLPIQKLPPRGNKYAKVEIEKRKLIEE